MKKEKYKKLKEMFKSLQSKFKTELKVKNQYIESYKAVEEERNILRDKLKELEEQSAQKDKEFDWLKSVERKS